MSVETELEVLERVYWRGNDGGWKIGDRLGFQYGSRTQVQERKSGRVLWVNTDALKPYLGDNTPPCDSSAK